MKLQIRYVVILGLVLMMTTWLSAQNKVGIGTVAPDHRLHISGTDSLILKLENLTPLNTNVRANLLFKTGNRFTGAIKTIGTSGVDARLGLFTFASLDATFLKERMSILDNGMVGI